MLLLPFGAFVQLEELPQPPGNIWVALAGPRANAGLSLLSYGGLQLALRTSNLLTECLVEYLMFAVALNLLLACFNILPCFPMDGGRVLGSLLAVLIGRFWPRRAAEAFVLATGICVRYVTGLMVCAFVLTTLFYNNLRQLHCQLSGG